MEPNNETNQSLISENTSIEILRIISLSIIFTLLVICTILGNLFVMVTIHLDHNLQRAQYILICCLAFTDLAVGVIVMPIAAVYDLLNTWTMGLIICNIWITVDVCLCTASILHLLAIAIDRYWSVSHMSYMANPVKRKRYIRCMIGLIWLVSALLSLAPYFGWKDAQFNERVLKHHQCLISQAIGYQIFSTLTAFYVPLVFLMIIYAKLHEIARERLKAQMKRKAHQEMGRALMQASMLLPVTSELVKEHASLPAKESDSSSRLDDEIVALEDNNMNTPQKTPQPSPTNKTGVLSTRIKSIHKNLIKRKRKRSNLDSKRENKAWKTLAIITGSFVACWLPFFILAVIRPMLPDHTTIDSRLTAFTLWLGYANSTLNPVIYTIFNPEFQNAFRRMIARVRCW